MPEEQTNIVAFLANATTEMLVNELARRAKAKEMSVPELLAAAGMNWDEAAAAAAKLRAEEELPHDNS